MTRPTSDEYIDSAHSEPGDHVDPHQHQCDCLASLFLGMMIGCVGLGAISVLMIVCLR